MLRYNGYEIRTAMRIVITSKPNRMTTGGTTLRRAHLPKDSPACPQPDVPMERERHHTTTTASVKRLQYHRNPEPYNA